MPSQWETLLQSNAVSHRLGANLESALWCCGCKPCHQWLWSIQQKCTSYHFRETGPRNAFNIKMLSYPYKNINPTVHLFHIPQCSIQNRNAHHFCSEWSIVGYGTGAFWDLWIRSVLILKIRQSYDYRTSYPAYQQRKSHCHKIVLTASLYPDGPQTLHWPMLPSLSKLMGQQRSWFAVSQVEDCQKWGGFCNPILRPIHKSMVWCKKDVTPVR